MEVVTALIGLGGVCLGALISYKVLKLQLRGELEFRVIESTAETLGMYFEDFTNPERRNPEAQPAIRREAPMRPETSQRVASQQILISAVFDDELAEEFFTTINILKNWKNPAEGAKFVDSSKALMAGMVRKSKLRT